MKLSFMTFACPEWTFAQAVKAAARLGYHGIEPRVDATHRHGAEVHATTEQRREMRNMLEGEGVEIPCLATSLQVATDRLMKEAPARIDLASDLGAKALRVFCGPMPGGLSMPETIERAGNNLRMLADLASQSQIAVWLETHDTFSRAHDAAAAARFADHPLVGINYDNMHPYRMGEDLADTFAALGDLIRHSHFHDAVNSRDTVVIKPVGEGQLPIDDMFMALINAGYDGYLSGEWFHFMYGPDPDTSLERYHRDMAQLCERHNVRLG